MLPNGSAFETNLRSTRFFDTEIKINTIDGRLQGRGGGGRKKKPRLCGGFLLCYTLASARVYRPYDRNE